MNGWDIFYSISNGFCRLMKTLCCNISLFYIEIYFGWVYSLSVFNAAIIVLLIHVVSRHSSSLLIIITNNSHCRHTQIYTIDSDLNVLITMSLFQTIPISHQSQAVAVNVIHYPESTYMPGIDASSISQYNKVEAKKQKTHTNSTRRLWEMRTNAHEK